MNEDNFFNRFKTKENTLNFIVKQKKNRKINSKLILIFLLFLNKKHLNVFLN